MVSEDDATKSCQPLETQIRKISKTCPIADLKYTGFVPFLLSCEKRSSLAHQITSYAETKTRKN